MYGFSTNSRNRWNSRPRPVKFSVSLLVHRRIFSRCWIQLRRVLREYAVPTMHSFDSSTVTYSTCVHITDKSNPNLLRALLIGSRYPADPFLIANSFI